MAPQLADATNNTQWLSDVLPKEAIITSAAYNIGDFGGTFSLPADSADSSSTSAPSALDTADAADVFEPHSIVVGGDDFFNALASRASCCSRRRIFQ